MFDDIKKYVLWPLVSIVGFLIIIELILLLVGINPYPKGCNFTVNRAPDYPEVFLKDKDLFWRLRPDQTITSEFFKGKTYRINRQGFRGGDFEIEKKGLRVAVLGNSCAFGWSITYEETFADILRQRLIGAGIEKAQVYNFAVPGYSSFQGKLNYSKYIRDYKPDVLIVAFGWNDQWLAANARPDNKQKMPPTPVIAVQNILARFRFYRLYKSIILSIMPEPASKDGNSHLARVSLNDFKVNLSEIIDTARSDGTRVILLTSPIPSLPTYYGTGGRSFLHENHHFYNDAVRETAAVNSVGLVDLAAVFDRYYNLFDDVEKDPFHYNSRGHDLAATEIFRFLMQENYLNSQ
jgi:lysophospholipase L1-like esterase